MATSSSLPVFNEDAPCPKCGFVDDMNYPSVNWCSGSGCDHSAASSTSGDHLHETCALCGYEYLVKPKDAKKS